MVAIDDLKQQFREKVPLGIDIALQALKRGIPADVPKYNDVILLESRYRELNEKLVRGVMDDETALVEFNKLRESILNFINALEQTDFSKETAQQAVQAKAKKGKVLYRIPDHMQVQKEVKCLVRIAFNDVILMTDLEKISDDTIKEVRIADVMGVELIDPNEQKAFSIRTFSEKVQTVNEADFSEWLFYVKPLQEGSYSLLLKVAVVEIVDGLERKREVVLEETVQVVAETVEEGTADFKDAGYDLQTSGNAGDEVAPVANKKKGSAVAATLLTGIVLAFIAFWFFQPQLNDPGDKNVVDDSKSRTKEWENIDLRDSNALIKFQLAYQDSDTPLANEAAYQLESLRFKVEGKVQGNEIRFEASHGNYPMRVAVQDASGKVLYESTIDSPAAMASVSATMDASGITMMGSSKILGASRVVFTDANGEERVVDIANKIVDGTKIEGTADTTLVNSNPNTGSQKKEKNTESKSKTGKKSVSKKTDTTTTTTTTRDANKKTEITPTPSEKAIYSFKNVPRKPIYRTCYSKRLERKKDAELLKELNKVQKCTEENIPAFVARYLNSAFESSTITTQNGKVRFVIEETGKVSVQFVDPKFEPAFRKKIELAIQQLPTFIPGQDELGKPTKVLYDLPIQFKQQ